ncbi:hypothetical protein TIFTF001_020468 [Ficus carica]|uniref:Uncharacterized protein n=1 Tax=Ficus carica TaxID=3494 RepID=A0AA88AAT0_FICCA|nr:hypothetical protein TIFTF001_020468 [Ficus carica]
MAVDVCSEISSTSLSTSPRISFSHDLNQTNPEPREDIHRLDSTLLDSSSDFNFCILNNNNNNNNNNVSFEISTADELFSDGKILTHQIKRTLSILPKEPLPSTSDRNSNSNTEKRSLKEFLSASFDTDEDEKPPQSKSFWQFRRSSSLNFDSIRGKSLIRSLQFLSRSNSTGSVPNPKQSTTAKRGLQKQSSVNSSCKKSSSFSNGGFHYYANNSSLSRKNCGSHGNANGNGVNRVSPVLNLPHPYISKVTISFFGFGSLFCNGKVKKKKN